LTNAILEIDEAIFDKSTFNIIISELTNLRCGELQIRLLSKFSLSFIKPLINYINSTTINYIELHICVLDPKNIPALEDLIKENASLNHVFIYGCETPAMRNISNLTPANSPLNLGHIYFVNYSFENGNCCGIINFENLSFQSVNAHNKLKPTNGCLDKKISFDKFGNIKNCPSMPQVFGNVRNTRLRDILNSGVYLKYSNIKKDDILICKNCEFRYNCTDCRAFIQNSDDILSKPLKCGYDPVSCTWQDWSLNILKNVTSLSSSRIIQ